MKFTGLLPRFLEKFQLKNLNLSFNDFERELPINGVFTNAIAISIDGNSRLCGGLPEIHLPKCIKERKNGKKITLALIIVIPPICLLVGLTLVLSWLFIWHKRSGNTQSSCLALRQQFTKYSYEMLLKATNRFSSENLISIGGFSHVYKGLLEEDGTTVSVKVLNLDLRGGSMSFMAEWEAWRNIRHRNLVKIISLKALVYEFMSNGSLESL